MPQLPPFGTATSESFIYFGREIFARNRTARSPGDALPNLGEPMNSVEEERFNAYFGVSPFVCTIIWKALCAKGLRPQGGCMFHLLWALMFMKLYTNEKVLSGLAGTNPKTFSKWSRQFVRAIALLHSYVVSFFSNCVTLKCKKCMLTNIT